VKVTYDASNVENSVKFLGGAMAEMNDLPWEARTQLIRELHGRGELVKAKYGAAAMKLVHPSQWFRGTVNK
jgi:hypothetical protein